MENHLAGVEQRRMAGNKQSVHMENRQCVQQDVAGLETPVRMQGQRVRRQIPMRDHCALASTGRAGGIENRGEIIQVSMSNIDHWRRFQGIFVPGVPSLLVLRT